MSVLWWCLSRIQFRSVQQNMCFLGVPVNCTPYFFPYFKKQVFCSIAVNFGGQYRFHKVAPLTSMQSTLLQTYHSFLLFAENTFSTNRLVYLGHTAGRCSNLGYGCWKMLIFLQDWNCPNFIWDSKNHVSYHARYVLQDVWFLWSWIKLVGIKFIRLYGIPFKVLVFWEPVIAISGFAHAHKFKTLSCSLAW